MKAFLLLFLIITMTGCTEQSVVKSTALRYVIEEYEAQLAQEPDKAKAEEKRKQTRMEIDKVEMISEREADVFVKIQGPSETRTLPVHLVRDGGWSVKK